MVEPLAQWSDMLDRTYDIEDVQQMHQVLDEITRLRESAKG